MAGKLQWASQSAFKGLGRAMLRPIIDQKKARSSAMGPELQAALDWWLQLLRRDVRYVHSSESSEADITVSAQCANECICSMERKWMTSTEEQIHLYADARSSPPRVAAVLFRRVCDSAHLRFSIWRSCTFLSDGETFWCDAPIPEHMMATFDT